MKKVYDKTITRLAEMSRACYMHATEVADEKKKGNYGSNKAESFLI